MGTAIKSPISVTLPRSKDSANPSFVPFSRNFLMNLYGNGHAINENGMVRENKFCVRSFQEDFYSFFSILNANA